jgi:protein-L-isoaspartate(D-aspartate) O-methyltransferase
MGAKPGDMKPPTVTRDLGFVSRRTRARLVHRLKEKGIRNLDVLAAVGGVPRHQFVDEALASRAYEDIPLPIGYQQTISQPFIVALMSEKLLAGSAARKTVLEVGTGCGYQTAILAHLYEWVCSIERIQPLFQRSENTLSTLQIDNIELRYGDGYEGWKGRSNFDSILLTAAPQRIPPTILAQLAPGGCLVAPVGKVTDQRLRIVSNKAGRLYEKEAEAVRFVPLVRGISE